MFDLVFLDCDSTLSSLEGIDELAREAGVLEEISKLTNEAMAGRLRLEDVYSLRLERIRPDRAALERLGRAYVRNLVPGAAELVAALTAEGVEVHVVSGGLKPAVLAVAEALGVVAERVHAVDVEFDEAGRFLRHEEGSPLARSGGKAATCAQLLGAGRSGASGLRGAIVGDGMTDAEAAPPCELFVGFGGVVARESVRALAGAWVPGPSLMGALPHLRNGDRLRPAAGGRTR